MHKIYLEDEFDHKIVFRLPRIGISRDDSVCLFLNKNIQHLARTTEDYALVRFIGGSQRESIAIPHRSSSYFLRCTSVRFSIARIFMIFTPKSLFINLLKNIQGSFRAAKFLMRMLSLILRRIFLFEFRQNKNSDPDSSSPYPDPAFRLRIQGLYDKKLKKIHR